MPFVKMEKICKCFEASDYEAKQEFETIDECLDISNKMCQDMNETFCGKHRFRAVYENENMIIKVEMNG